MTVRAHDFALRNLCVDPLERRARMYKLGHSSNFVATNMVKLQDHRVSLPAIRTRMCEVEVPDVLTIAEARALDALHCRDARLRREPFRAELAVGSHAAVVAATLVELGRLLRNVAYRTCLHVNLCKSSAKKGSIVTGERAQYPRPVVRVRMGAGRRRPAFASRRSFEEPSPSQRRLK